MERKAMADPEESAVQVKFRLRRAVLKKAEKAAKAHGRSVNREIQRRIEQSFEVEDRSLEAFGPMVGLLKAAAGFIAYAEGQTGKKWADDPETAALVVKLWKLTIKTLAADEKGTTPALKLIAAALTDEDIKPGDIEMFRAGMKGASL
jgi:hypothetical protein